MQYNAILKIISDGRITIPQTIRETMGLKHGDVVAVTIQKLGDNEEKL